MQSTRKTAGHREPAANRISGVIPSPCTEIAAPKTPAFGRSRQASSYSTAHACSRAFYTYAHSRRHFCVVDSGAVLTPFRALSHPQGHVIVKPNLLIFKLIGGYGYLFLIMPLARTWLLRYEYEDLTCEIMR